MYEEIITTLTRKVDSLFCHCLLLHGLPFSMLFPERVRGSIARVIFYVAAFIKSQELCEMEQVHFFDWHADKCCLPQSNK
jgi:hypothetical protein